MATVSPFRDPHRDVDQGLVLAVGQADLINLDHVRVPDMASLTAGSCNTVSVWPSCDLSSGVHSQGRVRTAPDRRHDMFDQHDARAVRREPPHNRNAFVQFGWVKTRQPFIE